MSDLRLAATQALEAWFRPNGINYVDFKPYMEALRAALAEPEQKPIAYFDPQEKGFYWAKPTRVNAPMTVTIEPMPLYAAPTPRKPLTIQELRAIYEGCGDGTTALWNFARAVEAAHGIKEQEHE